MQTENERSVASVFPQRSTEDSRIDWTWPAEDIDRLIRAQAASLPLRVHLLPRRAHPDPAGIGAPIPVWWLAASSYGGCVFIREGNGVVIVAGANARRGRNRGLVTERVRTDNGSEYAATECFRTLGGYLTSHP